MNIVADILLTWLLLIVTFNWMFFMIAPREFGKHCKILANKFMQGWNEK